MCHVRMAMMHLPKKFCANSSIQFGVIDIFQNPRWRPPPSWIFKLCKFGTFRRVNSVVLELCIKFGSNICDSHWDQHIYAPDVHLMTSRELTSGFNFWSGGHIRMVVVHLPIKFGVDICIQSRLLTYFRNSRWRPPPSWIFKSCTFGTFRRVHSVVLELYIKFGSNICDSHWDQHIYALEVHLMTSREWLPVSTSEIQDGGRRHLGFLVLVLVTEINTFML